MKDSRHAGSDLGLLEYSLAKYSRNAGSDLGLLVYKLSEGFKACWKCFRSACLLPS